MQNVQAEFPGIRKDFRVIARDDQLFAGRAVHQGARARVKVK